MRRTFRLPLLVSVLALALAACGGGDDSDDASGSSATDVDVTDDGAPTDETDFTLPEPPDAEFEDYAEGRIRFANFWRVDGEGSPVDLYWGSGAETGEPIATLEYGEVSDWYTMRLEANPFTDDDEARLRVVIQRPGDTSFDGFLQTVDETLDGGDQWTLVMGWTDTFNPDRPDGMTTQLVFEEEVGDPPAGQALLLLNDIGIRGLEGEFISLDAAGTCNQEWLISNDIAIGNAGTAYPVPAGAVDVVAHDANITDCAEAAATEPLPLDLADGDRYLVLAWGTSREERTLTALEIEA